jgi:hypothetical protein
MTRGLNGTIWRTSGVDSTMLPPSTVRTSAPSDVCGALCGVFAPPLPPPPPFSADDVHTANAPPMLVDDASSEVDNSAPAVDGVDVR